MPLRLIGFQVESTVCFLTQKEERGDRIVLVSWVWWDRDDDEATTMRS